MWLYVNHPLPHPSHHLPMQPSSHPNSCILLPNPLVMNLHCPRVSSSLRSDTIRELRVSWPHLKIVQYPLHSGLYHPLQFPYHHPLSFSYHHLPQMLQWLLYPTVRLWGPSLWSHWLLALCSYWQQLNWNLLLCNGNGQCKYCTIWIMLVSCSNSGNRASRMTEHHWAF